MVLFAHAELCGIEISSAGYNSSNVAHLAVGRYESNTKVVVRWVYNNYLMFCESDVFVT